MNYCEPRTITQGERAEWSKSFSDYPATLYTLKYLFRGPGTGINVTATADGTGFDVEITKTQSAGLTAGKWLWQAQITEIADANNVIIFDGSIQVKAGFVVATTTALATTQTANEIVLASLKEKFSSGVGIAEYEISTPAGSRKIKYGSMKDLQELISYYQTLVNREFNSSQGCRGNYLKQVLVSTPSD